MTQSALARQVWRPKRWPQHLWQSLEGPTWLVLLGTYGNWLMLTAYADRLPWFILLPFAGVIMCLHGSLQHELIHGHPTSKRWLNHALGFAPLALWIPFAIYRDSHLEHHRTEHLTHPERDPESFYVSAPAWARMGRLRRNLLVFNNTLLGRLLIGPPLVVGQFWWRELRRLYSGDKRYLATWLGHGIAVSAVLWWALSVCGITFWQYVLFFVWPGIALTLLRSYAEHRPAAIARHRTAIVECCWFWQLLFLNNSYHALHHLRPGLAWYQLPRRYRTEKDALLAANDII